MSAVRRFWAPSTDDGIVISEIYILGFIVLCIHEHVGTTHKRGGTNIRYFFHAYVWISTTMESITRIDQNVSFIIHTLGCIHVLTSRCIHVYISRLAMNQDRCLSLMLLCATIHSSMHHASVRIPCVHIHIYILEGWI
ncbi:hypothetical protein M9434_005285 [Picochlorum sp. BPE23]|nr:hypothetical protein M9434_005285 [Picochlorum sp. BPE23]